MSEMISLEAAKRDIVGKQVRQLRREGLVPVVVYGPDFESLSLQVDARELRSVLKEAGGTHIINLKVGRETINTLARSVQRDPIRGDILHVDFYRVDLKRPIRAEVSVVVVGESPVVESGEGMVLHLLNNIEVEALPTNLPSHLEVDVSALNEIGATIYVRDLALPEGVEVHADPDEPVVKIDYAPMLAEEEEGEEEETFLGESVDVEVIRERKEEEEEEE
ncbi:MAG: 50S ribosomal protein L25/general stress protein Ctc [Anaerolineae bacterium]